MQKHMNKYRHSYKYLYVPKQVVGVVYTKFCETQYCDHFAVRGNIAATASYVTPREWKSSSVFEDTRPG